jgi:hypothetical protein
MSGLTSIVPPAVRFVREIDFQIEVSSLMSATPGGPVTCHLIGESEEGRPLMGFAVGSGPIRVSLIAGSHADEPVGPETLRALIRAFIKTPERFAGYLEDFTFVVIPHVNPDGEERNLAWIKRWPSIDAYLDQVVRELPGRDIEFGYPAMRVENQAVSVFLSEHGPFNLHASLHGMAFSDGALLLIGRDWIARTKTVRQTFARIAEENGFKLHDHDRGGDKGFEYIGAGFSTTPRGAAMRAHFLALGDPETAEKFHDSSMELVRTIGGEPLCLVTELPLFLIRNVGNEEPPGVPETYLRLKESLTDARLAVGKGRTAGEVLGDFDLEPVPIRTAMRMQLETLEAALEVLSAEE